MRAPIPGKCEILWRGRPSLWEYSGVIGVGFLLLPVGIGFLILLLGYLSWCGTLYVVSDKKVGIERGIFVTSTHELRVSDVRSINVRRRGLAGLMGIGDIILSTAARDDASIVFSGLADTDDIADLIREVQDGGNPKPIKLSFSDAWSVVGLVVASVAFVCSTIALIGYSHAHTHTLSTVAQVPNPAPTASVFLSPSPSPASTPRAADYTVIDSQRAAVRKYSALGVAGSDLNRRFIARLQKWQRDGDARLGDNQWPEMLADELARDATTVTSSPSPTATRAQYQASDFFGIAEIELRRRLGAPIKTENHTSPAGPFKMLFFDYRTGHETFFTIFADDGLVINGYYQGVRAAK